MKRKWEEVLIQREMFCFRLKVTESWPWLWQLSCWDPAKLYAPLALLLVPVPELRSNDGKPPPWGMGEAVRVICDCWYVMPTYLKHSMGDTQLSCDLKCFYKTKKRYFTPSRMWTIQKIPENNKCWWGCGEIGPLVHFWWDCKRVQMLQKTVGRFLKKLKIELPYDLAIPLGGIYLKELKTGSWRDICTSTFTAACFTIAKVCSSMDE